MGLVDAGLVEPMHGKQRGLRLTRTQTNRSDSIPLVGAIAAGRPIEALAHPDPISLPNWLRGSPDCYALRVYGQSMRDAGIMDGDIVVIEPRKQVRNGEMVVALIDQTEVTLKRIEQLSDRVRLHAENPAFPTQEYAPERVNIQGVVVSAMRRY